MVFLRRIWFSHFILTARIRWLQQLQGMRAVQLRNEMVWMARLNSTRIARQRWQIGQSTASTRGAMAGLVTHGHCSSGDLGSIGWRMVVPASLTSSLLRFMDWAP